MLGLGAGQISFAAGGVTVSRFPPVAGPGPGIATWTRVGLTLG